MLTSEIPLQFDMFTSQLVDNRTAQQKQQDEERWRNLKQMEMFPQRDIAQFGVNARPVMSLSPGKLTLISEDPRTEEEIEQDRLRQAEDLTSNLFPTPPISTTIKLETTLPDQSTSLSEGDEDAQATDAGEAEAETLTAVPTKQPSKYAAYIALVQAAEERAKTISNTPIMALAESIGMNIAKLSQCSKEI